MITDVIFDFFGTLVDYSESRNLTEINTSYEYLCQLGFNIDKEKYIKEFDTCFVQFEKEAIKNKSEFHMHDLGKYFFKTCFNYSINDNINKKFIRKYINDWNIKTTYYDNIYGFIKKLSKKYRLCILSNTHYPDLIYENLNRMNIINYFFKIYTSVEIGIRKPNKEIFEFVLNDLKINSINAVFIGDNYYDDYFGSKTVKMKCYLIDKNNNYSGLVNTRLNNLFELLYYFN